MTFTLEYKRWQSMRDRCQRPATNGYARYGGAGIKVCDRWQSFENFYADMGPIPSPDHQVDRIDNAKGYEPGNCRWATRREQANNKRGTIIATIGGQSRTIAQWADASGLKYDTVFVRHKRGVRGEALLAPVPNKTEARHAS
jgi:hypothetical protein